MSTKGGVFKLNWNEFAGKLPFLTDLGEGSSVVSGGPGRYAVWSPMSAVGGAMQEAYELLERRSLDGCIAACFDAEERGAQAEDEAANASADAVWADGESEEKE